MRVGPKAQQLPARRHRDGMSAEAQTCLTAVSRVERTVSDQGAVKFLFSLRDGTRVESVAVPMRLCEKGKERITLCVSTQAGCRMGCVFCATGRSGFRRNLTSAEITAQVLGAEQQGFPANRIVFMGMGEPFDNFDPWQESVERLAGEKAGPDLPSVVYSREWMTVSTCGLVPGIERFARLRWRKLKPAISLNAPNDAIRNELMPVNRRQPMAELREALLKVPLKHGVLMAEYVLFDGVNDRREHALELAAYLEPFRAVVNLIPFNAVDNPSGLRAPTLDHAQQFRLWLQEQDQYARLREPKGVDIGAGCGQLAGR